MKNKKCTNTRCKKGFCSFCKAERKVLSPYEKECQEKQQNLKTLIENDLKENGINSIFYKMKFSSKESVYDRTDDPMGFKEERAVREGLDRDHYKNEGRTNIP